ncbi:MAG: hypothetical protein DMG64_03310 [Acidobacteria bacterium]|nr:MAG: hypothetical protein DMG64_03310 [Acidobacteriota bacterium]
MSRSPRILYVTSRWPDAAGTGAHLRSLNLLRGLEQMGSVEVLVLNAENRDEDLALGRGRWLRHSAAIRVNAQPNSGFVDQLAWTIDPKRSYPNGWSISEQDAQYVRNKARDFDLVWFYKLVSPDLFPDGSWPSSVVDIDDLPSSYERRTLKMAGGLGERILTARRLFTWRRRERLLGDRFSVLSVCSEEDKRYLKDLGLARPIHVIPNGFDEPLGDWTRALANPPRIGFVGRLDHEPNRDGIQWFIDHCWSRIKSVIPNLKLRLVGPGTELLQDSQLDIESLGWLPSVTEEMKTWSVMVVPIRLGAGTCVKVAHGFSQRCPIVSTSLGARGYDCLHEREMYSADSPEMFASACVELVRDLDKAQPLAERAWDYFVEKWSWKSIYPKVWAAAEDCLSQSEATASYSV